MIITEEDQFFIWLIREFTLTEFEKILNLITMKAAFIPASMNFLDDEETARIAENLAAKYGRAAAGFAAARAERAHEVGDELAHAAWRAVFDATGELLARSPWCYV